MLQCSFVSRSQHDLTTMRQMIFSVVATVIKRMQQDRRRPDELPVSTHQPLDLKRNVRLWMARRKSHSQPHPIKSSEISKRNLLWTVDMKKKMCRSKKHQVCGIVPTDSTVERERAIINWEVLRFSLPISLRLLHFVGPTLKTDRQRDEAWCIFWRLSRWTCQFCGSWVECCHWQGQWKHRQRRLNRQIHLLVP